MLTPIDPSTSSLPCVQLLLLFVFAASYVAAVSDFYAARGRLRAGLVALLAAISVCVAFNPWTVGVMLVAGCFVGVGSFIAATVALSRLLGFADTAQARTAQPSVRLHQGAGSALPRQAESATAN